MRFEAALIAMREGKKVHRPHWPSLGYLRIADGKIWRPYKNIERVITTINAVACLADDWEVVDEQPPAETEK